MQNDNNIMRKAAQCCKSNNVKKLAQLIEENKEIVSKYVNDFEILHFKRNVPLLSICAAYSSTDCCKLLIKSSAKLLQDDERGSNAIEWAVVAGNDEIVRILLEAGINIPSLDIYYCIIMIQYCMLLVTDILNAFLFF